MTEDPPSLHFVFGILSGTGTDANRTGAAMLGAISAAAQDRN